MESRTKRVLGWAGALAAAAAAIRGLVVRSRERRWGAAPIDLKRTMPGDDLVENPNIVTNRAFEIEAMPTDIWPALSERSDGELRPGDVLSIGAAGKLRVAEVYPGHGLVLVPVDYGEGQASWAMVMEPFAADRTRLLYRARLAFGWGPSDLIYRMGLDEAAFLGLRGWILEAKTRAENACMNRRQQQILYQRQERPREFRPRQHLGGSNVPPPT